MQTIPFSLYIHMPWCVRKCPYCDFNSHTLKTTSLGSHEAQYIDALIADLHQSLANLDTTSHVLHSIFFGGGTPSLFAPESYTRLLAAIFNIFTHQQHAIEITLEANPGTADEGYFHGYRAAGINRLSIGVQSFSPEKLLKLGRIHTADQAHKAFHMAKAAGFERINLDIMFGLPDQTAKEALWDLDQVIALNPSHLSWYQLTLEPNTVFYKKPPRLPHEDILWEIETLGKAKICEHYQQYEISAYYRKNQPDEQCQHNLNYWQFGDYLGIGAGAHSKITNYHHDTQAVAIQRIQKKRQPDDYMRDYQKPNKDFIAKIEIVPADDIVFEFMLNALRLYQPIDYALFEQRTHLSHQVLMPILLKAQEKKLISIYEHAFEVTELGHQYLNDLQAMFLVQI